MRLRSAALGAACLALMTLAAMRWMAPAPIAATPAGPVPPVPSSAAPAVAKASGRGGAGVPAAPAPAQAQPPVHWRELQASFDKATSLRAFFYEAVRRPGDGGYYYAMKAIGSCGMARRGKTPATAAGQAALDRMRLRCDFSAQEIEDAERQLFASRDFKLDDDPLYREIFASLRATSDVERTAFLRLAIDQGNPEVIAPLAATGMEASLRAGLPHDKIVDPDQVVFATSLLACRLGADCGPGSEPALLFCTQFGWCADSVDAALRAGLGARFGRIDAVVNQAIDNIRKGNLVPLVPPRFHDPRIPPPLPPK